jgi:hypothetical protein
VMCGYANVRRGHSSWFIVHGWSLLSNSKTAVVNSPFRAVPGYEP